MWADEGISVSFQVKSLDLMRFGSRSTASVISQSWNLEDSKPSKHQGGLWFILFVAVYRWITLFLTVSYYTWRGRWDARVFISLNAVVVMIYGQPSPGAKWEEKKKSSELHEASCYGSITQACNRLTFQTHTLAFRQPLVGQVFFTRKHTARGDQHMFCWHKFKIYCRCQKWLLDKVDY